MLKLAVILFYEKTFLNFLEIFYLFNANIFKHISGTEILSCSNRLNEELHDHHKDFRSTTKKIKKIIALSI